MFCTLTDIQKKNRYTLLKRAYLSKSAHIPSALSMLDYFYWINKKINYGQDALVIGKPYGQLAYHTVWNSDNNELITGNTQNIIWADTTLGNCLGVSCGLALSNKYNTIFVNTSDASLQEGTMLEAAQFIGYYQKFKAKIVLCIDCNKQQRTGILFQNITDILALFNSFHWNTKIVDGHNDAELSKLDIMSNKPLCIIFNTIKGYGIEFMQNNPVEWHYKKLTCNDYYTALNDLG